MFLIDIFVARYPPARAIISYDQLDFQSNSQMAAFLTKKPYSAQADINLQPLKWGMVCSYFGLLLLFRTLR